MTDPFPKCKKCGLRWSCRKVRAGLVHYFNGGRHVKGYSAIVKSLCPDCVLNPNYFKTVKTCRRCNGTGEVTDIKTSGTRYDFEDDLLELIWSLERLPERMGVAVKRWMYHVELGEPVELQRWMRIGEGWVRGYIAEEDKWVCYIDNAEKIAVYYIRTKRQRRPTVRAINYYKKNLCKGLRLMALEYTKLHEAA